MNIFLFGNFTQLFLCINSALYTLSVVFQVFFILGAWKTSCNIFIMVLVPNKIIERSSALSPTHQFCESPSPLWDKVALQDNWQFSHSENCENPEIKACLKFKFVLHHFQIKKKLLYAIRSELRS